MDRRIVDQIQADRNEMKKMGYDLENIFLVLNESLFKKDNFQVCGFSTIYEKDLDKPYYFKAVR